MILAHLDRSGWIKCICDPSDQNESHVRKLHFWENSNIWSKDIFCSFSDIIGNGHRNMPLTFLISHIWWNSVLVYFGGFC